MCTLCRGPGRTGAGGNRDRWNNWPDLETPTLDDVIDLYRGLNLLPVPWVESEDVANALLFLASDEARYITGVRFPVDAGMSIK